MDKFFETSSSTIQAIKDALVPVAAKIGQGAEYAWTVVVKQQYVEGITGLMFSGLAIFLILLLALIFWRMSIRWEKTGKTMREDKQASYEQRKNAEALQSFFGTATAITLVAGAILSVFIFAWAYDSMLHLLNPDYYALQFFIDMAKPAATAAGN